jgi:hypothetical protein
MQREQQPPKVGDKVFLPELQIWGEVVAFYNDNSQLITQVQALVNGKPTLIDVTGLIVNIAQAVQAALPLIQKIGQALKSLCQKLGLCKKPVRQAAMPQALIAAIEQLQKAANTKLQSTDYWANEAEIDRLLAYFPSNANAAKE